MMYGNKKKNLTALLLCTALSLGMLPPADAAAAKKVCLSSTKVTVRTGQSKVLKVKNTTKKISWKLISGKTCVSVKRKSKTSVQISGKKKGTAKLRVVAGKKKLTCKVIVRDSAEGVETTAGATPAASAPPAATIQPTGAAPVISTPPTQSAPPTESTAPTESVGPTNAPADADAAELAAVGALVSALTEAGAAVQYDMSSEEYQWDHGKLTEIHWGSKNLSGNLDVSGLPSLRVLECSGNGLESLDVSGNTALAELDCSDNPLKKLDVSGNAQLAGLSCWNNGLESLDISKNTALVGLDCSNNSLQKLDVSGNVKLVTLSCWGNGLNSLNVSENTALSELDCAGNPLEGLDVSGNTALSKLNCSEIASSGVDVTKNTQLVELSCWGNQWENLDVSQNENLEKLFCGSNSLHRLDVSGNKALTELSCGDNPLEGLDVSGNKALTRLSCERGGLRSLDVAANDKLTELSCGGNGLSHLDVSGNTALIKLACGSNQLESLDVTKNSALESLSCGENPLQSLDLTNNTKLKDLAQDSAVEVIGYDPLSHTVSNYEISDNMKWWSYGKFGMFIHFGAYSEYGQGEWAMNEQKIEKDKYQKEVAAAFNPTDFQAEDIVKCAKAAGMKYIVITAKHHEGFSMWDTQVESFKDCTGSKMFSLQKFTEFGATGRDILMELKTACEKEGLKFGLYYSIVDWNHSSQTIGGNLSSMMASMEVRESYIADMKEQLRELVERYDPAVIWFDGDWSRSNRKPTLENWWTKADGIDLYDYMKSLSSDIVVNERVCRSFGLGDFECPEREIPRRSSLPKRAWETCQSMNDAWGYKEALEDSYYSSDKLIQDLATVAAEGGNYLLNIGPKGNGEMTDGSRAILEDISKWIGINGESIYNAAASPFEKDPSWGTYTRKDGTVYAHVCDWPGQEALSVERYDGRQIERITILGESCELNYRIAGDHVIIQKPEAASEKKNLVLAIQYQ